MNSQMTIGKKLMLAFGLMMALIVGLGYSSLSSVGTLAGELDKAVNKTAKKTEMAGQMQSAVVEMRAGQRGLILFSMMKESAKAQSARQAFQGAVTRIEKVIADIRPLLTTDRGREAVNKIENGMAG